MPSNIIDEDQKEVKKTGKLAISRKRAAVEFGYYEDEFVHVFGETYNQIPIISLIYAVRVFGTHTVADLFIESFNGQTVQFVNLGAGLDTLSFYLLKKHPNVICFDTDLETQVRLKCELMSDHKIFTDLIPDLKLEDGLYTSRRYKVLPLDLTRIEDFQRLLDAGLSKDLPTMYLAEFSSMYVESEAMNKFLKFLNEFSNDDSVYFFSESFIRKTVFGRCYYKVITHFGSDSMGCAVYRTSESQIKRYEDLCWKVKIVCLNDFYNHNFETEEKKRILKLENFKDMNDLGNFCSHLIIGLCYKSDKNLSNLLDLFRAYDSDNLKYYEMPFGINLVNPDFDISLFRSLNVDTLNLGRLIDDETMDDEINNYFDKI